MDFLRSTNDESYCYIINGDKYYFSIYHEPKISFKGFKEVKYLGIAVGIDRNSISSKVPKPQFRSSKNAINDTKSSGSICAYCECHLNRSTHTRDHVIPRSQGGSLCVACCYECNQEKKNMMPRMYLRFLRKNYKKSHDYIFLKKHHNAYQLFKRYKII